MIENPVSTRTGVEEALSRTPNRPSNASAAVLPIVAAKRLARIEGVVARDQAGEPS